MTPPISNTKVRAPRLTGVVPRQRLFDQIDAMRTGVCRLVWLAGAPGSGKTTLAAAYVEHVGVQVLWLRLDPADADPATLLAHLVAAAERSGLADASALPPLTREHFADVARYARLLFRALFAALPEARVVVFDDVHTLAGSSACERILAVFGEELPEPWCMLATSRERPPDALARLVINGVANELPGASLAFTVDETRHFLVARNARGEDAPALHDATHGWAAALTLRAGLGAAARVAAAPGDALKQIHSYLNAEVFRTLSAKERGGFLKLAWLPAVRAGWATALGVPAGTQRRLETMAGHGILVQTYAGDADEPEYRFHPLFGDFLRERARDACSGRQLLAAQRAVVDLLQGAGMAEAALGLMLEMTAWAPANEAIVALSPAALAAARHRTVIAWAQAVPEAQRSAWLLFWLGQAQMVDDPASGRAQVRKAYAVFKREPDPSPRHRALAAILATYFFEYSTLASMSPWLAEFQNLGTDYDTLDDDSVRAVAVVGVWSGLVVREPQRADLAVWESRMLAMLALDVDPNVKIRGAMLLGKHFWYTGQHPRIWPLVGQVAAELDKPGVISYSRLVWHLLLVYDAWARDDLARGRQAVSAALDVAEHSGIRVIDCHLHVHAACFALARGDEDVPALLERATAQHNPARRIETWHLCCARAWQALLAQTPTRAIEHAAIALEAAEPIGPPPQCMALVAMCYALLGAGDTQALVQRLQRLAGLAADSGNRWGRFHALLVRARLAQRDGDVLACRTSLAEAFVLGRENHLYGFLFAEPRVLANLCAQALHDGIEPDYARELVRRQRLVPPEAAALREAWPWPLRIYTLGRFGLVIDGKPLASRGKAQKKSLDLLKAAVALGGREVDAGELADILWPDAEGDAARSAFDMTVHRLRKLLGRDDAVAMREGKLSLNAELCWVDVWAFERGLGQTPDPKKALELYQGAFLGSEPDHAWLLPARERLRQRFLRAVLALGRQAESRGQWDEAASAYEHALEKDSAAEELYRRLMICHLERRDHAAMLRTYERCRDMLSSVLGVRPSSATEAVFRSLPLVDPALSSPPRFPIR